MAAEKDAKSGAEPEELPEEPACFKVCRMAEAEEMCIRDSDCHVLIDAGISGKRIENGLNSIDLKTADMQGILITHEHIRCV